MYGLVGILLFEVGRLCVSLGALYARVWDDCWNLRVVEGLRCLGRDGFLEAFPVVCTKVTLQLLRRPVEILQGFLFNIKYVYF